MPEPTTEHEETGATTPAQTGPCETPVDTRTGATTLLTVMVYDISDDWRRRKMHALLLEYGLPVQRSAFEGRLTATERGRLAARATPFIDPASDMLVIYTVPREQERAIRALGMPRPPVHEQRWFII